MSSVMPSVCSCFGHKRCEQFYHLISAVNKPRIALIPYNAILEWNASNFCCIVCLKKVDIPKVATGPLLQVAVHHIHTYLTVRRSCELEKEGGGRERDTLQ